MAIGLLMGASRFAAADKIHTLVKEDNAGELEKLLASHSDGSIVNDTIGAGITPLHMAASLNRRAIAEILIAHGATIDARTQNGFTPLHWAANRDAVDVAELLIQHGASINITTPDGITPLHWAASKNATGVLKKLLLAGADTSLKTEKGFDPLRWAVMKDATEAAELLAYKATSDKSEPEMESPTAPVTPDDDDATDETGKTEGRMPPPERPSLKQAALVAQTNDVPMAPSSLAATDEADEPLAETPEPEAQETPTLSPAVLAPVDGQDCSLWIAPSDALAFRWVPSLGMWIGKYEITNHQFRRFNEGHSSLFYETYTLDGDDQPVVRVSWDDANRFCAWVSTNETIQLPAGFVVRLPSEAEWMAAASCGTKRIYPWGDTMPPPWGNLPDETARAALSDWEGIAGYDDGSVAACDVESSGANENGIFGLAGNVWEWCGDAYGDGKYRIRKGGSWDFDTASAFRIDYRGFDHPDVKDNTIGFRVVLARTPTNTPAAQ